jgi:predicted translin family RNA/ssDNA-binding protein
LKEQLEAEEKVLKINIETQKQMQTTIDSLTKRQEANSRTVHELREKQKQFQLTIDALTKTVEALNQTVNVFCTHPQDVVSTRKVEDLTTSKLTEFLLSMNIVKFPLNIVVS